MKTLNRLFDYARERKYCMILALVLSGVATICSFVPYYFFWKLLEEITGPADIAEIQRIAGWIFVSTLVYTFTYITALLCSHLFAFRLETNMRIAGVGHLLEASFAFFDENASGKIRKLIDDNASNTHTVIAHMLPDSVNAIIFPICLLGLAFMTHIAVGCLIVAAILFAGVCFQFMYHDRDLMQEYMAALEGMNADTVEYVRGIQVVKIFDMVVASFAKLYQSIINYSVVVNKQCKICRKPFILFQCGMMCFGAGIIMVAFNQLQSQVALSKIVSLVAFFMTFAGLLHNAFMKIMFFSKNYSLAQDAIDKLEQVFSAMDQAQLPEGDVQRISHFDIKFEDVSFEYEEGHPVVAHLNLTLAEGKKYALVGTSGSGKSTLAKLASGFYPLKQGRILIGGHDIRAYDRQVLSQHIAFVFQNAKLFKTSIYENVRMGNPNSSDEAVMTALKLAMCDSILDKFPQREHTLIGAKGVHLSGGEIQRIAIARAILKDAPIIILDEASAASDPENEYEMQQAFSQLMKNKTVIMIAHRLSSIKDVDRILVMEQGQIIEQGSHQELMDKKGQYHQFQTLYAQANEWRM